MTRAVQYSQAFPPRRNAAGQLVCRWPECDKVLTGRRTSFCSDDCRDRAMIRCWPTEQRRQTFRRDHGICAACGLDCEAAWAIIRATARECRGQTVDGRYRDSLTLIQDFLGVRFGNRQTFWEANHRLAVIEGGGACDLDNLETLCLLCHRAHTADLAARRARARRPQLELAVTP